MLDTKKISEDMEMITKKHIQKDAREFWNKKYLVDWEARSKFQSELMKLICNTVDDKTQVYEMMFILYEEYKSFMTEFETNINNDMLEYFKVQMQQNPTRSFLEYYDEFLRILLKNSFVIDNCIKNDFVKAVEEIEQKQAERERLEEIEADEAYNEFLQDMIDEQERLEDCESEMYNDIAFEEEMELQRTAEEDADKIMMELLKDESNESADVKTHDMMLKPSDFETLIRETAYKVLYDAAELPVNDKELLDIIKNQKILGYNTLNPRNYNELKKSDEYNVINLNIKKYEPQYRNDWIYEYKFSFDISPCRI